MTRIPLADFARREAKRRAKKAVTAATANGWYSPTAFYWPATNTTDGWYCDTATTGASNTLTIVPCTSVTGDTWIVRPATTNGTADAMTIGTAIHNEVEAWTNWIQEAYQAVDDRVWMNWVGESNHRIEVRETRAQAEARRLAQEQQLREMRAAEELRRKMTAEADRKAKQLLIENISKEQRRTLRDKGYFDVQVKGKTYRIRWGSHGNVYLVHGDREVVSYCIQPPDVPPGDAMLAQKLLLETDEASFLKIANARQLVA